MDKWFELFRSIVMPAQCDGYGHMNVRYYAGFFDDAAWHFPAMAGLSLSKLNKGGFATVVATMTTEFHNEIKAGELVLIKGAVTRVGTKSFSYEMRLYEPDSMRHCATHKAVEVCFDMVKRQSAPLPEDFAAKLRAIAFE